MTTRGKSLALALALGLAACPAPAAAGVGDQATRIRKPVILPPSTLPAPPPAVIDDTLAIGGEDIKARKVRTRMTVEVLVNGRGPYRFLVDSGADTSVVGRHIAKDLNLPLGTPANLHGTTDTSRVDRVLVDQLTLGPVTVSNLQVPALQERDLGGAGMIGIDALVSQRLMMDFETRTIKVEDARRPVKALPGDIVVTALRRRGQLILTEVRVGGLAVEAVIDTGSEITIGNLALRNRLLRGGRNDIRTIPVTGVTGVTVELQLARIAELRLGSVSLRDVPIAFADVAPFAMFGLSAKPALLLGTDLMETFRRISLDFRARKVRFQLRRCGTSGVTISTESSFFSRISSGENGAVCQR